MLLVLGTLAESDPEAAQLLNDIVTLSRPLAALHQPPWPQRLVPDVTPLPPS